ncbi:MAG: hypothetical protein L0Z62_25070, partial [Gemmataceae bacterium]|nr:hypothetical protein [Gemmataceae bacterium]
TWPHGLCYVNELWGGSEGGYLLVSDSNYDWGQGLRDLRRWRRRHGVESLDVWYFGSDPRIHTDGFRNVPFHVLPLDHPEDVSAKVRGGRLAVSTTMLYGNALTASHKHALAFLRDRQPVGRTTTFLIYDLTSGTEQAAAGGPTRR